MAFILWLVLTLLLLAGSWALNAYLGASRQPARPRLEARVTLLENLSDDLDKRLEYLTSEIKSVRGRQYASEKRSKDEPPSEGDRDIMDPPTQPSARSFIPTAHLSRRFKGG